MTDLDDDRLELLERQLAERVTERVRPALFRLYATVGVSVIGALSFVSWDIVDDIKSEVKQEIKTEIADDIEKKREEIRDSATEIRITARRANEIIDQVEKQLVEFQPQAENLDKTIEMVREIKATSRDLQADYSRELEPLIASVESLSSQLTILAEQVNQVNASVASGGSVSGEEPAQSTENRTATIESVISDTKKAEQRFAQARDKTTVFFQFAGGAREQAEVLSTALKLEGYIVPGEDREVGAARKHEVRYFHEEDKDAAQQLANDTTLALYNLAYPDQETERITAVSMVSYTGKKTRLGVLELWLEISAVSPTSTTAWSQVRPNVGWCYQEENDSSGPEQYSVHCHWSEARCISARGPSATKNQSACEKCDLSIADWNPRSKGWQNSWYELKATPFVEPFPQLF